jgi:hypothetical protein
MQSEFAYLHTAVGFGTLKRVASSKKSYPSWEKHRVSVPIGEEEYEALDRLERFLQNETGDRSRIPYTQLLRVLIRRGVLDSETVRVFRRLLSEE